jgi:predicted AAA+ superfamily ATPase
METKEREIKGLVNAMEEFNMKRGLVITESFEGEEKIKNKDITYKPLWKWLIHQV